MDELLSSIDFGSARGGKRQALAGPLMVEVVRELGADDLDPILNPPRIGAPSQQLTRVRHTHHQLAKLLSNGCEQVTASAITGYSQSYISILVNQDPAFKELLSHYSTNVELIFVDVMERMKALGINAIEELQERLETEPDSWTKRELMELVELTVNKPKLAERTGQANAGANHPALEIRFVAPEGTRITRSEVIDLEPQDAE